MLNNANLNQLLQTVIYLLIVFVIPAVGYYLSAYLHHTGGNAADQRKRNAAEVLVKAAEQTLATNPEKLAYVEARLTAMFPSISLTESTSLIEAAVLSLHSALGTYRSPVPADPAPIGPDDHPAGEPPMPLT